ncbi:MAG: stage III sporulation protein AG [Clostridiaceae bacterium]|nr:stage III sporulation protein AG [Clostridiaceae bacterium]
MELINGIIKKIKDWIAGQDRKKLIENTAVVIIIGVIIIIAGSVLLRPGKGSEDPPFRQGGSVEETEENRTADAGDALEIRLKSLLSQIQGVGKVDVMITYSASREYVPAYDIKKGISSTEESDSEGGERKMREEEYESAIAYEDSASGGKRPVVLKQLEPEVKGVLVVAEGAENVEVRDRICNAVTVVLDVPMHKVKVIQRKK